MAPITSSDVSRMAPRGALVAADVFLWFTRRKRWLLLDKWKDAGPGWLHEAAESRVPVVLNAAGLTHTSVVLGDACALLTAPLIEVHISNVYAREPYRHTSYVSARATGVIAGLGVEGYVLALSWLSALPAPAV